MNNRTKLTKIRSAITLSLTCASGLGLMLFIPRSTLAQSAPSQDLPQTYQTNEKGSLSGTFGNDFNPFDLIHSARFANGRSNEEFDSDSNENINDAALEFKRQQQQLILEKVQPSNNPADSNTQNR